jgi:hypothetical protein
MSEPIVTPPRRGWRGLLQPPRTYPALTLIIAIPFVAFALGVGVTTAELQRQPSFVPLTPTPITTMRDWSPVAVKGQVAEIFGNKFVIQDQSGRALVETGPQGEGSALVANTETVTVQGRFEHGFIHAVAISHADGHNDVLGPPGPPHPPGLLSWGGPNGWAHRLPFLPHG